MMRTGVVGHPVDCAEEAARIVAALNAGSLDDRTTITEHKPAGGTPYVLAKLSEQLGVATEQDKETLRVEKLKLCKELGLPLFAYEDQIESGLRSRAANMVRSLCHYPPLPPLDPATKAEMEYYAQRIAKL